MKQKSKGVYRTHIKAIKKKATFDVVFKALWWFSVGALGVLAGKALVVLF